MARPGKASLPSASRSPTATPGTSLSPCGLERLDRNLGRHVGPGRLPGLVAVVSCGDDEHGVAIGTLGFDRPAPMRRDTIFRMASVTKVITAVATMMLVEDCRLRLDDPVDDLLPELANRRVLRTIDSPLDDTVPAVRPITVRDLLTFRSGYGEVRFLSPTCPLQAAMAHAGLPLSSFDFPGDADAFMQRLGQLPLAAQPGELWLYHMSAEILGVLIARASGLSLSGFFTARIFDPLGMSDTGFSVPRPSLDRLANCYAQDFAAGDLAELPEASGDIYAEPPAFESGGGDRLVSTADDMLAFGRMLLNNGRLGRERLLSRASVEAMATDQLTESQKSRSPFFPGYWDSCGWGLGVGVVTRRNGPAESPGRFGWDGAYSTSLAVDPGKRMVGVFMAQCRPRSLLLHPAVRDFWTSAYAAVDDR
jgi:CubicO group peptidase (beta-lactamase class C family)